MTALAACGGSGHAATPATSMPGMSMPASTPPAPAAPVAGNAVEIKNFGFSPGALTVKAGTTVTWTNGDEDPHTVSATGGPFHSPTLTNGGTFHYTFTKPGRYAYICTIHPFMHGTVVVTK
ncbi:cupredoxin domain-containing protein [Actinomadura barringtoniae]|nr:cupredoxin family copper-binding protein [Actinomadura barringtoniae]